MGVHHVLECTNVTGVEVMYSDIKPTYLFKIRAYIGVKCDFMPQSQLLFFQNGGFPWHRLQEQNYEPIEVARGDKSWIWNFLVDLVPVPELC